jgi:protein-S-isoprenylcysteine O-methyltransferase Ste14
VTSGPYQALRHPGYTGALVSLVGLALSLGNSLSVVIIIVGVILGLVP